jgi:regulatory protein
MKITRIESQKKRPGRKSLFADGAFLIGVSTDTLLSFGLRTGDEITPETVRKLEWAEELLAARTASLRYLAVRPRTVREIRDALREKEFSDTVASETIASLKEAHLLDDAQFARSFIRNMLALKPAGRILMKRKLLLLGIERRVADEALDEVLTGLPQDAEADRAAAAFLARKSGRGTPDARLKAQLTSYLARRGYAWDIVRGAVKRALKDDRLEEEDL